MARQFFVFGNPDLSTTLVQHGLFDEFRLCIVPIMLGNEKPLFGNTGRLKLELLEAPRSARDA